MAATPSHPPASHPPASYPPALATGEHGGDGRRLAEALGVTPCAVLDLSASLNPLAPPVGRLLTKLVDEAGRYPDPAYATAAFAEAIGVGPGRLLLTNGGSEAIALVSAELRRAVVVEPEFSLWRRHLQQVLAPGTPRVGRVRSNPNNPTGALAGDHEVAAVWDEAFYALATGHWTRGDADRGATVVGSLTKLFACPGLRLGYVLAPGPELLGRLARRQPAWSVSSLALAALPALVEDAPLTEWAQGVARLRSELAALFEAAGFRVESRDAPWVLVAEAAWLRPGLAREAVLVRDCANFGLPGWVRVAVPAEPGLERLARALDKVLDEGPPPRPPGLEG